MADGLGSRVGGPLETGIISYLRCDVASFTFSLGYSGPLQLTFFRFLGAHLLPPLRPPTPSPPPLSPQ